MSTEEWGFAFVGTRLIIREGDGVPTLDELDGLLGPELRDSMVVDVPLPDVDGQPARALDLPHDFQPPDGFTLVGLRAAHALLAHSHFRAAGTALQKVEWLRTHRFCSRCSAPLVRHRSEESMVCPECDQFHFPRVAPAVIVLVEREGEALLGRSPHFTEGVYSTLAGFVEPGESLEECVHREIFEEVGVKVRDLRYFGSQPHPFPHSLMIGFVAQWDSGDISIDPDEIEDARWFTPHALPGLPHPMSIARRLVEDFIRRNT